MNRQLTEIEMDQEEQILKHEIQIHALRGRQAEGRLQQIQARRAATRTTPTPPAAAKILAARAAAPKPAPRPAAATAIPPLPAELKDRDNYARVTGPSKIGRTQFYGAVLALADIFDGNRRLTQAEFLATFHRLFRKNGKQPYQERALVTALGVAEKKGVVVKSGPAYVFTRRPDLLAFGF